LQKWKEQVTAAEKEAFNAWQAHDELKQKVCVGWKQKRYLMNRNNTYIAAPV
jgi:hypothetical protein